MFCNVSGLSWLFPGDLWLLEAADIPSWAWVHGKSSKSWTSSVTTSQPLTGKAIEYKEGPHFIKQQGQFSFNSWMPLDIQLSFWAILTNRIFISSFFSMINLAIPSRLFSWCLWLYPLPVIFDVLCCKVDFSASILDILVVLRKIGKNSQDMNDKHKDWERTLKKKEKKKATSLLSLTLTFKTTSPLSSTPNRNFKKQFYFSMLSMVM